MLFRYSNLSDKWVQRPCMEICPPFQVPPPLPYLTSLHLPPSLSLFLSFAFRSCISSLSPFSLWLRELWVLQRVCCVISHSLCPLRQHSFSTITNGPVYRSRRTHRHTQTSMSYTLTLTLSNSTHALARHVHSHTHMLPDYTHGHPHTVRS